VTALLLTSYLYRC